jgi:hypothetical protein
MNASHPTEISSALGWRFFAGIMMLLLGIMNMIDGLVSIIQPDVFETNQTTTFTLPVTDRLAVWGWVALIVGVVMMAIAFPVIAGLPWARFAGIGVTAVNLLLQFAYVAHFPWWSLLVVLLNVLVLYGLAARGGVATELDSR